MITTDKKWSKVYDGGKDFRPLFPIELERIFALLPSDTERRHLDIGCGTGGLTRDLFHRGYTSVGVDPSALAIEHAKVATIYLDRGIDYLHNDFESVALPQASYSLITCKLVYAFFQDKGKCIDKVYDLLAPKGSFVLVTKLHDSEESATPISADEHELRNRLKSAFGKIQEIDLEWATAFICQK